MPDPSGPPPGLVLLQMGGPRGPDELPSFMRSLFQDPEMIRIPGCPRPLQTLLGGVYGQLRARELEEEYEEIGYSPLVGTLDDLAGELADRLDEAVGPVALSMRYTPPRAEQAMEAFDERDVDHAIALPLYPFYSIATTGSSLKDLLSARDEVRPGMTIEAIHGWGTHPGHIGLVADRLETTLAETGEAQRAVLLSTHGLPEAYVEEEADTYRRRVETAARDLAGRFPDERVELAFQSDIGPVDWLSPSTAEKIHELADDGVEELVIVPFGFVAEHVETLEEIDEEYREEALEAGIDEVHRAPTFGSDEDFADLLASIVRQRLEAPA
jgi:ferrochelatase